MEHCMRCGAQSLAMSDDDPTEQWICSACEERAEVENARMAGQRMVHEAAALSHQLASEAGRKAAMLEVNAKAEAEAARELLLVQAREDAAQIVKEAEKEVEMRLRKAADRTEVMLEEGRKEAEKIVLKGKETALAERAELLRGAERKKQQILSEAEQARERGKRDGEKAVQRGKEEGDKEVQRGKREAQGILKTALDAHPASSHPTAAGAEVERGVCTAAAGANGRGRRKRAVTVFFHKELERATDGFSLERVLGEGGFGRVYLASGLAVDQAWEGWELVVKRLAGEGAARQGVYQEFLQELQVLGGCQHECLLPLVGFAAGSLSRGGQGQSYPLTDAASTQHGTSQHAEKPDEQWEETDACAPPAVDEEGAENAEGGGASAICLVLPLMAGGSLEDRLCPPEERRSVSKGRLYPSIPTGSKDGDTHSSDPLPPLGWQERVGVCVNVARGLEYLHTVDHTTGKPAILHGDVKPANVLLDAQGWAQLADVGLARMLEGRGEEGRGERTHVSEVQRAGTCGYLDPSYMATGRYDAQADCYALGITLLQVLTGWRAAERGETVLERCAGRQGRHVADPDASWPPPAADSMMQIAQELLKVPRRERLRAADARERLEALRGELWYDCDEGS